MMSGLSAWGRGANFEVMIEQTTWSDPGKEAAAAGREFTQRPVPF